VRAIRLAATKEGVGGEIFQIATNRETTVQEMLDVLLQVMKEAGIPEPKVVHGEKRQGDVMRNYSDTSKAKEMLGWHVKTELRQGLHRTVFFSATDKCMGLDRWKEMPTF
ncbi:MAG: hypothetical protein D6681_20785, partial [Calditrichaeota bacterium]